jgi:hypothetical protein
MRPIVKYGMLTERAQVLSGQGALKGLAIVPTMALMNQKTLEDAIGIVATSTHCPATLVKGTSSTCSPVYYGNWKYFYTMFWQDMALRISDQAYAGGISAFSQNGMFIIAEQSIDCAVVRGTALTQITDAETTVSSW